MTKNYLIPFRSACSAGGGPGKLPFSPATAYQLRKRGKIKTVAVKSRTFIAFKEIERINCALAAGRFDIDTEAAA